VVRGIFGSFLLPTSSSLLPPSSSRPYSSRLPLLSSLTLFQEAPELDHSNPFFQEDAGPDPPEDTGDIFNAVSTGIVNLFGDQGGEREPERRRTVFGGARGRTARRTMGGGPVRKGEEDDGFVYYPEDTRGAVCFFFLNFWIFFRIFLLSYFSGRQICEYPEGRARSGTIFIYCCPKISGSKCLFLFLLTP
jgi:hypothetical protein